PNWLATYLVTVIPIGIVLLLTSSHKWQKIIAWSAIVVCYAAFWYTYSRSGWIGLMTALIFLLPLSKHINYKKLWSWLVLLVITCGIISMTSLSMATQRTATSLESGELDSSTGQIRLLVWQGTLDVVKQFPLFGSGPETFAYSFLPHRPTELNQTTEWNFLYNKAHNEVLHIASTLGLIGLTAWLWLYY